MNAWGVVLGVAFSLSAYGFHSGGVADCDGCHTMHNSFEGLPNTVGASTQFQAPAYLLKGSDQSSTCLNCHAADDTVPTGHHVMDVISGAGAAPANLTPAGDFGWLNKFYTWTSASGGTDTTRGERHGHNVVALDYALAEDPTPTVTVSPGGSYPKANLACSSCHDPHGRYRRLADGTIANPGTSSLPIRGSGSYDTSPDPVDGIYAVGVYRLLAGAGYLPKSLSGTATPAFINAPPAAVAPSDYNRSEATAMTRVAYGSGMSEWCANCHAAIHRPIYTSGQAGLTHPAGDLAKLTPSILANYDLYVKTGDLSGTHENSFNSLVPFEEGSSNYTILKTHAKTDDSVLTGPVEGSANVQCLSCHRAHATAFDSMLRWSMSSEFITNGDDLGVPSYGISPVDPAVAQGRTQAESEAAYYGRPATRFAPFQRVLCNKCHVKD